MKTPVNQKSERLKLKLKGKNIVITRAKDQAKLWEEDLISMGANVLCMPLIKSEFIKLKQDMIKKTGNPDSVILTSIRAVYYLDQALEKTQIEQIKLLPSVCVGEKTKEKALEYGFKIEKQFDQSDKLTTYLNKSEIKRPLWFCAEDPLKGFYDFFLKKFPKSPPLKIYRTKLLNLGKEQCSQLLLLGQFYVLLASPSAVRALIGSLNSFGPKIRDEIISNSISICIGSSTKNELQKAKLNLSYLCAAKPSFEGIKELLISHSMEN